jgi:hypothetical protein
MIVSSIVANSKFSAANGTAGTVTVPSGAFVTALTCYSSAGGTVALTVSGPGQASSPSTYTITIPAGTPFSREWPLGSNIGGGSTIVFTSTDSYYVEYATPVAGGLVG